MSYRGSLVSCGTRTPSLVCLSVQSSSSILSHSALLSEWCAHSVPLGTSVRRICAFSLLCGHTVQLHVQCVLLWGAARQGEVLCKEESSQLLYTFVLQLATVQIVFGRHGNQALIRVAIVRAKLL